MFRLPLILTTLLLANVSWAMCAAQPEVLFSIRISACQPVTISSSSIEPSMSLGQIDGVFLSGVILSSKFVWHSPNAQGLEPRDFFETESYQTVFMSGEADEICVMEYEEERWFITNRPCCDVSPAGGACVVPWNIEVVTDDLTKQNWFPVEDERSQ